MTRVFEHARIWVLPQDHLEQAAHLIAGAATADGRVDAVVGVAQGGLPPARRVSELLGVPMFPIHARHNASSAAFVQASGIVECRSDGIAPGALHGRVLIVDDICGTGATLRAVTDELAPLAAPGTRILSATLCRNIGAEGKPDFHIWDVNDWVHFPWETPPDDQTPREPLPAPGGVVV